MPATMTGIVFNDANRNGQYSGGESGISGVQVVLRSPTGVCTTITTDANGNYSFPNLTVAGVYTLYETVSTPNGCPPTNFTQPTGFNSSTTARVGTTTVTQVQIDQNAVVPGNNFGHVVNTFWTCSTQSIQISGNPSNLSTIDLVNGTQTNRGQLNPSALYNAIGYNPKDNLIYGWNNNTNQLASISQYTTVNLLGRPNGMPSGAQFDVGDVDSSGHLYLYKDNTDRFYVIDIDQNSPTYLKLVDPANGFQEQTSNFGVAITPQSIFDWAFNPKDGQIYAVNTSGVVVKINPITGAVTPLSTSGVPAATYGAAWFDNSGTLYAIRNDTGVVYKIGISGSTATGTSFSQAIPTDNNDGARCANSSIGSPTIVKYTSRTAALPGDEITYTIVVSNPSNVTLTNVVVTDPIPSGTSFVSGSVTLNGSSIAGNPASGINIGSIPANSSSTLTFKVKIGPTIPNPNPIPNTASFTYDGGFPTKSNTVNTIVFDNSRGVQFV